MNQNRTLTKETYFWCMNDTEAKYIIVSAWKGNSIRIAFIFFPALIIEIKIELAKIIRSQKTGAE